jgi:hypothetical protein
MDNIIRLDHARPGPTPDRPARPKELANARLKRWLDAQVSPFARRAAKSRRSAAKRQQEPRPAA